MLRVCVKLASAMQAIERVSWLPGTLRRAQRLNDLHAGLRRPIE
jgi:hypothetical protein